MYYREAGQFKTTYAADSRICPLRCRYASCAVNGAPTANAGPDSTVHDPCLAAVSALAVPPLDSITSGSGSPAADARSVSRDRYPRSSGDTAASTIVVTHRSYSRNTPAVSCEVETCTSSPSDPATSEHQGFSATGTATITVQ